MVQGTVMAGPRVAVTMSTAAVAVVVVVVTSAAVLVVCMGGIPITPSKVEEEELEEQRHTLPPLPPRPPHMHRPLRRHRRQCCLPSRPPMSGKGVWEAKAQAQAQGPPLSPHMFPMHMHPTHPCRCRPMQGCRCRCRWVLPVALAPE
jgi:hypothetical protein